MGLALAWARRAALGAVVVCGLAILAAAGPAHAEIRFEGPIAWQEWAAGTKQAQQKKKPILLLLFTDSCPKCTLLGEVFKANKDVHKLAKDMVMVHVNSGTAPMDIVNRFARFGNYVPRIVFLRPDASTADEITSPNPQFPYYYQPSHPEFLIAAMQKAKSLGQAAQPSKPAKTGSRHSRANAAAVPVAAIGAPLAATR